MSKISLGTMFILSATLAACSDNHSSGLVARSEPMPAIAEAQAGMNLPTVYFAFDGVQLDPQARLKLDAEAARMMRSARAEYIVVGHADRVGSSNYNLDLGMRRALSVVDYLVSKGIARERLVPTVSFGEDSPVVAVDHAERLNRRVVILQKDAPRPANLFVWNDGDRASDRLTNRPEQPAGNTPGGETPSQPENPTPSPQDPEGNPGAGNGGGTGGGETDGPTDEPGTEQPSEPEDEQPSGNGGQGNGGQGNGGQGNGGQGNGGQGNGGQGNGGQGNGGQGNGGQGNGGQGNGGQGNGGQGNGGQGNGGQGNGGQGNGGQGNGGQGNGGQGNGGQGNGSNGGNQNTHTDAGRGNGAETGDPGNSGGHNNGGDDD